MKKSNAFIIFAGLLSLSAIAVKEYRYGSEHETFLSWLILGSVIGLLLSTTWVWIFQPRTASGVSTIAPTKFVTTTLVFSLMIAVNFFGMALINWSLEIKKATDAVQNWPSVSATIVGQDIYERPPLKTGRRWFAPTWTYTYEIGGRLIHSHSTSAANAYILTPWDHEASAKIDLNRRPLGSQVVAFYDPDKPEISVLDKKDDNPTERHWILGLGVLILFMSLFTTFLIGKKIKNGQFLKS